MILSASSISTFKACPMRYYYQYVLGLSPIEDTDSQRMGTNWHRIQQIASMEPGGVCECVGIKGRADSEPSPHCELCQGTGVFPDDPMDAVIRHLDKFYAEPPLSKTLDEWETEKIILLYSLIGYQWYYQDAGYEVESLEQKFDLPLRSPISNRVLQARLHGKIDRVFAAGTNRFVHEYKSTSKNIDPDSTYWNHLTLDTQTRLYTYAAAELGMGVCGVLYDVWSKPKSRPKKLTQADSKKFVADGVYCGEKFYVEHGPQAITGVNGINMGDEHSVRVNDKLIQVESGAKEGTFAIRETPEMFGARLLQDITERPEFYFARREVAHHSDDIEAFKWELFNIYQTTRRMNNHNTWWHNEAQCEATFRCSFIDFCYNHIEVGPDDVPENFRKYIPEKKEEDGD